MGDGDEVGDEDGTEASVVVIGGSAGLVLRDVDGMVMEGRREDEDADADADADG